MRDNRQDISIRRAQRSDLGRIMELRWELAEIHHKKRPDLFRAPKKMGYFFRMRKLLLEETPQMLVAVNRENKIVGYLWYSSVIYDNHEVMKDMRILHIEDIYVEKSARRCHVGERLCQWIRTYGQERQYDLLTLDVWAVNQEAIRFYEACGFSPQIIRMEHKILPDTSENISEMKSRD